MKHKLLKIANDLNALIVHSKENVECQFGTGIYDDEVVLFFFHYSDEYEAEVKTLYSLNITHQNNFVTNST